MNVKKRKYFFSNHNFVQQVVTLSHTLGKMAPVADARAVWCVSLAVVIYENCIHSARKVKSPSSYFTRRLSQHPRFYALNIKALLSSARFFPKGAKAFYNYFTRYDITVMGCVKNASHFSRSHGFIAEPIKKY